MNVSEPGLMHMTDKEFQELTSFMKGSFGIDLTKKRTLIEGRLTNELRQRGITSFQQYLNILHQDHSGSELTKLLNKLTTNVSYFMREKEHFEYLQGVVLPEMEKARASTRELRIWSAGCSTGQEPYNIAMVIDEYFGARKAGWNTVILATDISMNVLNKAREGIYASADITDIPDRWRKNYFVQIDKDNCQICEKIRREVEFRPFNLMDSFNFKKPFDFIFCRNVMIYFDAPTKEKLINKYYDWTYNGGYLFIGHSESLNKSNSRYSYVMPAIYQRRG